MEPTTSSRTGLILSGGGARAAYQIGVLLAIARLLPRHASNPFPIICGTSAGAVNAAFLAAHGRRFQEGVRRLTAVWKNFHAHQVYRCDPFGVFTNAARWLGALAGGGLSRRGPVSLLDNSPLAGLLERSFSGDEIQLSLEAGALRALSITASGYSSGQSVTFYQGVDSLVPWKRARRVGCPTRITTQHLLASSAIPFIFPPVRINREYFGDGSMRQLAPISPALHLGADRILVVGASKPRVGEPERTREADSPPLAQIAGHVLNSIFLDSLEVDLERLQRINRTLELIPQVARDGSQLGLCHVDVLVVVPSEPLEKIAASHARALPRTIRFLLRGIGATGRKGSNLVSYLLFERPFCRAVIALGYRDTYRRKQEIMDFLALPKREGSSCQ